jgi:hypothetical protein
VIPEGSKEQARPDIKPGRAYLTLAITDKNGNRRIVECEADIAPPGIRVNEPQPEGN